MELLRWDCSVGWLLYWTACRRAARAGRLIPDYADLIGAELPLPRGPDL